MSPSIAHRVQLALDLACIVETGVINIANPRRMIELMDHVDAMVEIGERSALRSLFLEYVVSRGEYFSGVSDQIAVRVMPLAPFVRMAQSVSLSDILHMASQKGNSFLERSIAMMALSDWYRESRLYWTEWERTGVAEVICAMHSEIRRASGKINIGKDVRNLVVRMACH